MSSFSPIIDTDYAHKGYTSCRCVAVSPRMLASPTDPIRGWLLNVLEACKDSSAENLSDLKKLAGDVVYLNSKTPRKKNAIKTIADKCLNPTIKRNEIKKLARNALLQFSSSDGSSPRLRACSTDSFA